MLNIVLEIANKYTHYTVVFIMHGTDTCCQFNEMVLSDFVEEALYKVNNKPQMWQN